MARITKNETLILERDEALSYIKNLKVKVRYQVFVHPFLPTEGDRGFEGCACLNISRKEMIRVVGSACSKTLADRGAKVKLKTSVSEYSDNQTYITLY